MSGLAVRSVTVTFGPVVAVDEVSLDVAPGEVVALLGPSGCGKSTLLRVVAGLEPAQAGSVAWDDVDLVGVPVHRRGFGLMFQDGQLFAHRDVTGNIDFGLRMAGMPRADRTERVAELLDLVGLTGLQQRTVDTLSGGEQQRVALARSLAPRPRLLLLDEPLSALDRSLRDRLGTELHDILRRTGTTALYVTHDHDEAFTVADRVAVMDRGRLLQTAPPQQLWRYPASAEVARFLGYRCFVPAEALAAAGDDVPHAAADELLALRPESLVVDAEGPLEARVLRQRLTRGGSSLRVQLAGVGEVEARAPGVVAPDVATVRLRVEPSAVAVVPSH